MGETVITKRAFLTAAAAAVVRPLTAESQPPNFVFIYADDLGYGDLGAYGSKMPTWNLNAMARDGVRFGQFYSASPVCSPSRAALLTGRYPTRVGVPRVLFPNDTNGLPDSEATLAQVLKTRRYKTMCVGKWHLGSLPQYLPTNRGFDEFFGVPYSHDMSPLPLLHNTEIVEQPANLETLTLRYTEQALRFIAESKDSPFFLYFAHNVPHIPLVPSPRFRGVSGFGLYGDVVREMDWSVGWILRALKHHGLSANTLVMFSSDNGPWYQGSTGRLLGRKGETYEGGVRVPLIAYYPGRIPRGGFRRGVATTMDILPTLANLAGASLPAQPLDGVDIWPLLAGEREQVDREAFLYFDDWNVQCARQGRWKLHMARYNSFPWTPGPPGGRVNLPLVNPELYDLEVDPEEGYDVARDNPATVADMRANVEQMLWTFPEQVRISWFDTMNRQVEWTPTGALPACKP